MPDKGPTCSQCGCPLEGRDVFEGVCTACREEQILGGGRASGKRARAAPVAPPARAKVGADEDTKEMEPVQGSLDDGPSGPLTDSDTKASETVAPAAEDDRAPLDLSDEASPPPGPVPVDEEGTGAAAPSPGAVAPPSPAPQPSELSALDEEALAVLPFDAPPADAPPPAVEHGPTLSLKPKPPRPEAPTGPPPSTPPAGRERDDDDDQFVFSLKLPPGLRDPGDEPERPGPSPTPQLSAPAAPAPPAKAEPPARLEPPPKLEPHPRLEPPARAEPPADGEAPRRELALADEASGTPDEAIWVEPRAVPDGRPARRPSAAAGADVPLRLAAAQPDEVALQAIERVDQRVQELALTVAAALRSGRGHSIGSGFRFCVGFVLGLGVLSALVVGGMYAVGTYLHPPTLELLQRLLRAVTGT